MSAAIRRILIADDHDIVRRGIRALLEMQPNLRVVAEAGSGHEALSVAHKTQPDIAILDYSLPEMNGFELTVVMKRELPSTEILIYTMHDQENLIINVLRAGARGFILKSESQDHLIAALRALSVHRPYFCGGVSEMLLEQYLKVAPRGTLSALTHREREVVQLIAEGRINKEIGRLLDISVKTVESHRGMVMQKLKIRSSAELVRYAIRNNIIEA